MVPSLVRAGAETQVVSLVNGLDRAHFEKHLFVFEPQLDLLGQVDTSRLQFHHYPRQYKFDIAPAVKLACLIDERQIDVVHCSLQIALLVGWLAIRIAKHKPQLVLALHTTVNRDQKYEVFDKVLYQWLMRSCNLVICVCKAQESYWQEKYPFLRQRMTVIYNGVDTGWFNPETARASSAQLRENCNIPKHAFTACCIAAFRPEKGHRHLLNAFKLVSASHPNVYLLLAGNGPLREETNSLVHQMGLQDRVRFLGAVADVRPVLMASNVSIMASTAVETFSMAMLESLAMGIPMIATDIGGAREAVLDQRTGLLVNPGDPIQLADALTRMVVSERERLTMGIAARELVMQEFAREKMVSETSKLLAYAVQSKKGAQSIVA